MEITPYPRRIRPELMERITWFTFKEQFGIDPDTLPETTDEEACEFVHNDSKFEEYAKRNGTEKILFAINEQYSLLEKSFIETGADLKRLKENLFPERYIACLRSLCFSEERADLHIQAYEEDPRNG
jgi:hypothetical protein